MAPRHAPPRHASPFRTLTLTELPETDDPPGSVGRPPAPGLGQHARAVAVARGTTGGGRHHNKSRTSRRRDAIRPITPAAAAAAGKEQGSVTAQALTYQRRSLAGRWQLSAAAAALVGAAGTTALGRPSRRPHVSRGRCCGEARRAHRWRGRPGRRWHASMRASPRRHIETRSGPERAGHGGHNGHGRLAKGSRRPRCDRRAALGHGEPRPSAQPGAAGAAAAGTDRRVSAPKVQRTTTRGAALAWYAHMHIRMPARAHACAARMPNTQRAACTCTCACNMHITMRTHAYTCRRRGATLAHLRVASRGGEGRSDCRGGRCQTWIELTSPGPDVMLTSPCAMLTSPALGPM